MPIQTLEVNVSALDRLPAIDQPGPEAVKCVLTCTCVDGGATVLYVTD